MSARSLITDLQGPDLGALGTTMRDSDEDLASLGDEQARAGAWSRRDSRQRPKLVLLAREDVDEALTTCRVDALTPRIEEEVVRVAGEGEDLHQCASFQRAHDELCG